jgi:glycosyltransferase involved in cell wall biosynthesis
MNLLSIVVPVYNEENNIGILIEKLKNLDLSISNFKKEIIIINDGSTDKSASIIGKFDEIIVINQVNQGKGSAVQNRIKSANGDYILIQDGDLEYNPDYIIKMCSQLKSSKNMSIYGSRYKPFYLGLFPKYHNKQNISSYLANIIFIFMFLIFYSRIVTDPLTGYKLYPKTLISRMPSLLNTLFYIFSMFLLVFGLLNVYILDGLHSLQYISENVINELKKDLKM